jgi:hypothetical protein
MTQAWAGRSSGPNPAANPQEATANAPINRSRAPGAAMELAPRRGVPACRCRPVTRHRAAVSVPAVVANPRQWGAPTQPARGVRRSSPCLDRSGRILGSRTSRAKPHGRPIGPPRARRPQARLPQHRTGTLHVQATLGAPIFEASFDDQKEVSAPLVPGRVEPIGGLVGPPAAVLEQSSGVSVACGGKISLRRRGPTTRR